MKILKYLALGLFGFVLTACSDDDKTVWNSDTNVTVEFAKPTASWKEGKGMCFLPLQVNGKANGNIEVTVSVTTPEQNAAVENKHYVITTKTIIIPDDESKMNLEFNVLDADEDINQSRLFTVSIVDVKGAEIGTNNLCEVTIRDNDADFYDKLSGNWNANIIDRYGTEATIPVKLLAFDEEDEGYSNYYLLTGLQSYCEIVVEYNFDIETGTGYLDIPFGQDVAVVNFTGYGALPVLFAGFDGKYVYTEGQIDMTWSADLTSLDLAQPEYIGFFPYTEDGGLLLWNALTIVNFTR